MMQQPQPPTQTCPNCRQPVPVHAAVCPNCGAALPAMPPIPVLGMQPVPMEQEQGPFMTGSRKGDITVGIVFGLLSPLVIPGLIAALYYVNSSLAGVVSVFGGIGQLVCPFLAAHFLKKKYPVAGDTMMKTLLFLVGGVILVLLGLLAVCLFGIGRP